MGRWLVSRYRAAAFVTAFFVVSLADHSYAATRECLSELHGTAKQATSETDAKRLALASWVEGARGHGDGYTRWQLAWNRRIACEPKSGGYSCQAKAAPCTIKQVPSGGTVKLRRGEPAASGR